MDEENFPGVILPMVAAEAAEGTVGAPQKKLRSVVPYRAVVINTWPVPTGRTPLELIAQMGCVDKSGRVVGAATQNSYGESVVRCARRFEVPAGGYVVPSGSNAVQIITDLGRHSTKVQALQALRAYVQRRAAHHSMFNESTTLLVQRSGSAQTIGAQVVFRFTAKPEQSLSSALAAINRAESPLRPSASASRLRLPGVNADPEGTLANSSAAEAYDDCDTCSEGPTPIDLPDDAGIPNGLAPDLAMDEAPLTDEQMEGWSYNAETGEWLPPEPVNGEGEEGGAVEGLGAPQKRLRSAAPSKKLASAAPHLRGWVIWYKPHNRPDWWYSDFSSVFASCEPRGWVPGTAPTVAQLRAHIECIAEENKQYATFGYSLTKHYHPDINSVPADSRGKFASAPDWEFIPDRGWRQGTPAQAPKRGRLRLPGVNADPEEAPQTLEADPDAPREIWNGWLQQKMVMRPSELAKYEPR